MAENPLLPHQRLKDLYALMRRVQSVVARGPKSVQGLEAVLAATLIQLEHGDVFCAQSAVNAMALFPPKASHTCIAGPLFTTALHDSDLPTLSSLIALGIKATERTNVAVSLTSTSAEVDWASTLTQAQQQRLPVAFLIVETAPLANATPLLWSTLVKHAKSAAVPTVSVDGEDAVALYRVVQESLHRARLGDGPTVIWCALPSANSKRKSSNALSSMERYLAVRGLLKPARKSAVSA